jgi:hypothetical protein
MSDHENEPAEEAEEQRELTDDDLDDVAGGYCVAMDQPDIQQ